MKEHASNKMKMNTHTKKQKEKDVKKQCTHTYSASKHFRNVSIENLIYDVSAGFLGNILAYVRGFLGMF